MELTPAQAEKEWASGRFRPVYYLFGEDAPSKSESLGRLMRALAPDPFNLSELSDDAESVRAAVSAACTPPLGAPRRLVVVRGARLGAEARKELAAYLAEPLDTTTFVLFSDEKKPDGKDALASAVSALGGLVVFRPLREDEAVRRLIEAARAAGASLEEEAAALIVEEAGTQWGILKAELEKMLAYVRKGPVGGGARGSRPPMGECIGGRGRIGREEALACLGFRQAANPFELGRTVLAKDSRAAVRLARRLGQEGVEPLRMLYQVSGSLNRQLKAKRMLAAGLPENRILAELRIFYDRDFMTRTKAAGEGWLRAALKACLDAETSLKSESWLDGPVEFERLLTKVCGKPRP